MPLKTRKKESETVKTNVIPIKPRFILDADLRAAAKLIPNAELRYLVDSYYIMQDDRKRAHNQILAVKQGAQVEPHAILGWLAGHAQALEDNIKIALDIYTDNHEVGRWIKAHYGCGPVIAAGLLAHIDIEKAPTVGHIWRYAGLDPTSKWEKGGKRPWNAALKVICWKLGQSFMKFSNVPACFYGQLYREKKESYVAANEAGQFAARCEAILAVKKFDLKTEAYKHYKQGRLPPAHVDAMARRWVVKLFLSHLHGFWYEHHFKKPPPLPYPIAHLGHAHMIKSPQEKPVLTNKSNVGREPCRPNESKHSSEPPG